MHTLRSMSGSHTAVSNLSYTNSTTKHPRMSKRLLPQSKLASRTPPRTSIAQTPPACHTHMEESLFCQDGRTTKIIPHCQLVSPHNAMQCYIQHAMSMLSKSSPLGTRSTRGVVLFQCYTHGSPRHRDSHAHETESTMHVGLSCIQGVVLIACHKSLLLHSSPHG